MPHLAQRLCSGHYHQQRRGLPLKPLRPRRRTLEQRLVEFTKRSGEHLLFTGFLNPKGYGTIFVQGHQYEMAHRVAHRLWVGEIPDGYEVDHLCNIRNCVEPLHLEAVTHEENVRRAFARAANGLSPGESQ